MNGDKKFVVPSYCHIESQHTVILNLFQDPLRDAR